MTTQRPKNENEVLVDDHAQRKESIKEEDQNNVSNESPKFFNDPWAWGSSIPILTDNTYCGNSNLKAIRGTIEEVAEMMKADLLKKAKEGKKLNNPDSKKLQKGDFHA